MFNLTRHASLRKWRKGKTRPGYPRASRNRSLASGCFVMGHLLRTSDCRVAGDRLRRCSLWRWGEELHNSAQPNALERLLCRYGGRDRGGLLSSNRARYKILTREPLLPPHNGARLPQRGRRRHWSSRNPSPGTPEPSSIALGKRILPTRLGLPRAFQGFLGGLRLTRMRQPECLL